MILDYFKRFSVQGLIKLVFGVAIVIMGLIEREIYISIIGAMLMILTLINKGYCPAGDCSVRHREIKK